MNVGPVKVPEAIAKFGFVGERKALALLSLGFFATVFALLALIASQQIPEWVPCFAALSAVYGVGFFALAAGWFWARWFAVGLGYSGLTMAVFSVIATRDINPVLVVFGGLHGLVALALLGEKMSEAYELRADWRQRWQLDDKGVAKVRNAVTRAASSLPSLIMFALAPREGAESLVLVAGIVGIAGLVRGRTWGVLALGTAGVLAVVGSLLSPVVPTAEILSLAPSTYGLYAGGMLLLAALPFAPAMLSFLARRPA